VHGYGGDKNSWLFVQEPLSAQATVHAIDLPGHGGVSYVDDAGHMVHMEKPSAVVDAVAKKLEE